MNIAQWDESFKTGDGVVDTQHQELFGMVNDLHNAIVANKGREVLALAFDKLAKLTIEHFETEEGLMERIDYPSLTAHRQKHQVLTGGSERPGQQVQNRSDGDVDYPFKLPGEVAAPSHQRGRRGPDQIRKGKFDVRRQGLMGGRDVAYINPRFRCFDTTLREQAVRTSLPSSRLPLLCRGNILIQSEDKEW